MSSVPPIFLSGLTFLSGHGSIQLLRHLKVELFGVLFPNAFLMAFLLRLPPLAFGVLPANTKTRSSVKESPMECFFERVTLFSPCFHFSCEKNPSMYPSTSLRDAGERSFGPCLYWPPPSLSNQKNSPVAPIPPFSFFWGEGLSTGDPTFSCGLRR